MKKTAIKNQKENDEEIKITKVNVEDDEKDVDFLDEKKEKRSKKDKSIISRILNIVLWIILFAWMAIVITDFLKVRNDQKPVFCFFKNETNVYSDGEVKQCTGLGYKIINYNRKSYNAIEFGPFWIKDRTEE